MNLGRSVKATVANLALPISRCQSHAANLTVSGNNRSPVFRTANGTIVISVLKIADGNTNGVGGGIWCGTANTLITNCTLADNSAHIGGGAYGGSVKNCTILGNTANFTGRGIVSGDTLNSIVGKNSAPNSPDCSGIINSLDFNLIGNTNGATITGVTTHNIYGQDPLLGPLADNGGPTRTHALLPGSPAIDRGSSGGLTTDQRGQPRPVRFPACLSPGDGSDIGAYEADPILRLTAIAKSGDDILLNFTAVFGRNNEIDSENNLNGSWTMVTHNVAGSGGVMQAVDAGEANQRQRFYRASQE